MDALLSFSFLIENLPSWKEQITHLSAYTSQKHEEFKAEYTRIVLKAKPRRVRSSSVCSIHTNDDAGGQEMDFQRQTPPPLPDPVDISPFEAGNRYIYAQATKKRKPGTSFRSGASGPLKFRSKQKVVIYYDSHVQDKLDALVKSIGGSRNNLRKGKMSYTVARGLQLPTLGRKHDITSPVSGLDGMKLSSGCKGGKEAASRNEDNVFANTALTGEAAFKHADKELEICQNLCETAAHQFLRDGDCKIELDTVSKNLDEIQRFAQTAFDTFKIEQKTDETGPEVASVNGSTHTESDATLVEKSSREMLSPSHKFMPSPQSSFNPTRPSLPTANSAPPMATEIEVDDDSDQSSIEIDISKYRTMNRAGNRNGVRA